jgi:hypothetical protein
METPYGEIPDKFTKDMRPQDMHDYLQKRFSRRSLLRGATAGGALAAAGPLFWRQADAYAATTTAATSPTTTTPQWVAYGADPATSYWISWSDGSANSTNVPSKPVVQYATDAADLARNHGHVVRASLTGQVPIPSSVTYGAQPSGNIDDTYYNSVYIEHLYPDTTYYYKVSNDGGVTWNPGARFTTAAAEVRDFTFAATGDESTTVNTEAVVASILAYDPKFTIVAGDLSYAGGGLDTLGALHGASEDNKTQEGYSPSTWDSYFSIIAEGAQYIPWIVGVGNHEMEPLTAAGYAGVLTRFPDLAAAANGGSNTEVKGSRFTFREPSFTWNGYRIKQGETYNTGSSVVRSFTYGNVAFIQLDGNDLSAEIANNNGYTDGQQTSWLLAQLATYRSPNSTIDFVIAYFHNCAYCSNTTHGSDAGIRNVWQPIFDKWNVDLVINGHVHAYERTNPLFNNEAVKAITSGGSYTNFYAQDGRSKAPAGSISGTTYICAGGGGQGLYTDWFGVSDKDGPAADETSDSNVSVNEFDVPDPPLDPNGLPYVDVWAVGGVVDSGTATGAPTGGVGSLALDPAYNPDAPYSAFRFATWSHLVVNVNAPKRPHGETSIEILSVDANVSPTVVQDSLTIRRRSVLAEHHIKL